MDDEATVATLSLNEDEKDEGKLGAAVKLDDALVDDQMKDDDGDELAHEIGGALDTLRHSVELDADAKQREKQRVQYERDGLGESLLPAETTRKEAAPAKLEHAFDDFTNTQKLYDDDEVSGEASDLGESDDGAGDDEDVEGSDSTNA